MPKGKDMILEIQEKEGKYFKEILDEAYLNGERNCDVSAKYGIAQSTINRYLNRINELGDYKRYGAKEKAKYRNLNKQRREDIEKEYKMPFAQVLRHLRVEKGLTCEEIGELLDCTKDTVSSWMNKLKVQMTISEARVQSIKAGRTNYADIHKKIRNGTARHLSRGSSKEEIVRIELKSFFEEKLPKCFEFIIGFTNWSILGDCEVDIPIVLINKDSNKIYKIAIEYDGAKFHDEIINLDKKRRLNEESWQYFNIFDDGLNREQLKDKIEDIILEILYLIEN